MTIDTNVLERTPERLGTEVGDAPSPLVETLGAVETGLKEGMHDAGAMVGEAAEVFRETVDSTAHAVESAFDFPGRMMQRHPWLVLGGAALAACLLFRLLRRDY